MKPCIEMHKAPKAVKAALYIKLFFPFLLFFFSTTVFAVPGVSARKLLLGTHLPLSGPAQKFASVAYGAKTYFRYINDQGGVHGRTLDYRVKDDRLQPEQTLKVTRDLVLKDQVFAMFNGLGTQTHKTVFPWLQEMGVPDFFIGSNDKTFSQSRASSAFALHPTLEIESNILASYLLEDHAGDEIVIWYKNLPRFRKIAQAMKKKMSAHTAGIWLLPSSNDALSKDIEDIQSHNPQDVVVLGEYRDELEFLQNSALLTANVYVNSALADFQVLQTLPPFILDKTRVLTALPFETEQEHPGIKLHRALMRVYAPEQAINHWTIYGHAVAELMVEVLRRAGRNVNRINVIRAAEELFKWQGKITPPVMLNSDNHIAYTSLRVAQVSNTGDIHYLSPWISGQ